MDKAAIRRIAHRYTTCLAPINKRGSRTLINHTNLCDNICLAIRHALRLERKKRRT